MKKLFTLLLPGLTAAYGYAQTWAADVAPILFQNCTKCHNTQGIAPFPLMTYDDAYNNKDAVKEAVMLKNMPPWPPQAGYGEFAHNRSLTAQQIQTISAWVDAGAPSGNLAAAPPAPVYDNNYEIQSPDLVVRMPTYTVNTDYDLYRCFVIPAGNTAEKFIKEIEVVPGNRAVVHHVLVFQDPSNTPANLDAQDPGPGYTNFGGTGSNASKMVGAWVPGSSKFQFPAGMGAKLEANTNIVLQVHYPGGTYAQTDSTQIRIKYATGSFTREVSIDPPINHYASLTNGPLVIPANTTKTFHAQYTVPSQYNVTLLMAGPHMHLIGRSIKSYGVTPQNDTIPLVYIPHWDFHWQGFYSYKHLMKIPGGTVIHGEGYYDNTAGNPHQPSSPPQPVHAGEGTKDEMMLIYFGYTLYLPGDENISQEDPATAGIGEPEAGGIVKTMQWYDLYPNPAGAQVTLAGFLPEAASLQVSVTDMNGRTVLSLPQQAFGPGHYQFGIPVDALAPGSYVMRLGDGKTVRSKTLVKTD